MTKEWYVIHTYSGYENKVKASLEERFTHSGVREKLGQVVIPTVSPSMSFPPTT